MGQSSFPTERMTRFLFLGSGSSTFRSFALAAKAATMFLVCTSSSVTTRSLFASPKIPIRAGMSPFSAAWISASAASLAVGKVFWLEADWVAEADCGAPIANAARHVIAIPSVRRRTRKQIDFMEV